MKFDNENGAGPIDNELRVEITEVIRGLHFRLKEGPVVSHDIVISTGPHATLLERYGLSRTGRDRSCQAFQVAPSHHVPLGSRA